MFVIFRLIVRARNDRARRKQEEQALNTSNTALTNATSKVASQETSYQPYSSHPYSRPNETYIALNDVTSSRPVISAQPFEQSFRPSYHDSSQSTANLLPVAELYDPHSPNQEDQRGRNSPPATSAYTAPVPTQHRFSYEAASTEGSHDRRSQALGSHPLVVGLPPTSVRTPQGHTAQGSTDDYDVQTFRGGEASIL